MILETPTCNLIFSLADRASEEMPTKIEISGEVKNEITNYFNSLDGDFPDPKKIHLPEGVTLTIEYKPAIHPTEVIPLEA